MISNRVISLLGLAQKAGKISSGEFASEKAVKSGKACLVIVAADASENTKKMFRNMCDYYKVPLAEFSDKEDLGRGIGKELRSSLAVTDPGLAKAIEKQLNTSKEKVGE